MNVASYVRVSTREQNEKGFSVGEQTERLRKYCESRDWTLVKTYTDGGYTGTNMERPAIRQLMQDCDIYDVVLVWKLDRLSRSQRDTLTLIEHFKAHNCAFVSMQENFDTSTPFGMAMVGMLSVFAQLEHEQIRERMALGQDGRAKQGKWKGGGHTPIGYDYDKASGKLVPNEEADQVRLIFDMFLSGSPYTDITEHMHARYTTRYSSYNSIQSIKRVLCNPVYIGCIKHKDTYIPDCHEAIIDPDTFDRAQAIIQSRKNGNKNAAGRHLLTGMVYCECGKKMVLNTAGKYRYYACWRRYSCNLTARETPCDNRRLREDKLNEVVLSAIKSLKFNEPKRKPKKTVDTSAELRKIDNQIGRLIELFQIESIDIDTLKERIADLEEKKALLTAPEPPVRDLKTYTTIQSKASEVFDTGDLTKSRAVVDALVRNITVTKDSVKIRWEFA